MPVQQRQVNSTAMEQIAEGVRWYGKKLYPFSVFISNLSKGDTIVFTFI
jgi:hypothetical protein